MNAIAPPPIDEALQARAEALEAAIGGVFGVPVPAIAAYVAATERRRDPAAAMVRAWFGPAESCGPGAIEAGRQWLTKLRAIEDRQTGRVAAAPAPRHLAHMRDEDPEGVPLAHYIEHHEGVGVRFSCRGCAAAFDVPIADVVAGLKARRLGDERTGVRAVAKTTRKPCAKCGGREFETRPAFQGRKRTDLPT